MRLHCLKCAQNMYYHINQIINTTYLALDFCDYPHIQEKKRYARMIKFATFIHECFSSGI